MEQSKGNKDSIFDSFLRTHQLWLNWLTDFNLTKLTEVPSSGGWSIGQLYLHLINETDWYLDQAAQCLGNEDHAGESMTDAARSMFLNDSFPEIRIKGDPLINDSIPQPESKEVLLASFASLAIKARRLWSDYQVSEKHGKSQHPGLNYFSPEEWVQYADMHMRHHIKQKQFILEAI